MVPLSFMASTDFSSLRLEFPMLPETTPLRQKTQKNKEGDTGQAMGTATSDPFHIPPL